VRRRRRPRGQQSCLGQMSSAESGGGATVPDFCGESHLSKCTPAVTASPGRRVCQRQAAGHHARDAEDKVDQQLGTCRLARCCADHAARLLALNRRWRRAGVGILKVAPVTPGDSAIGGGAPRRRGCGGRRAFTRAAQRGAPDWLPCTTSSVSHWAPGQGERAIAAFAPRRLKPIWRGMLALAGHLTASAIRRR